MTKTINYNLDSNRLIAKGESYAETMQVSAKTAKLQKDIDTLCNSDAAKAYRDAIARSETMRKAWIKDCYDQLRAMGLSCNKAKARAHYIYDHTRKYTKYYAKYEDADGNTVTICPDHASKHESIQQVRCKVPACVSGGYIDLALTPPDAQAARTRKAQVRDDSAKIRTIAAQYDRNDNKITKAQDARAEARERMALYAHKRSVLVKRDTIKITRYTSIIETPRNTRKSNNANPDAASYDYMYTDDRINAAGYQQTEIDTAICQVTHNSRMSTRLRDAIDYQLMHHVSMTQHYSRLIRNRLEQQAAIATTTDTDSDAIN